jgi:predicted phage terminase large subunit-like protein
MSVVAIQRNKDKITRAYDAAPFVESGNVYLPQGAEYLPDIMREASQFPNSAHDDTIDPMMDAIDDILSGRNDMPTISIKMF